MLRDTVGWFDRMKTMGKFITLVLTSITLLFFASAAGAASKEIAGDRVATDDGDLIIHPVEHATFLMSWKGKTIYVDPVGGGKAFEAFPHADLVLITDIHGDHLNADTVKEVVTEKSSIVAPKAVADKLPEKLK